MTKRVQEVLIRMLGNEGLLKLYPAPSSPVLTHEKGTSCYVVSNHDNFYRCNRPKGHPGPHIRYSVRASHQILWVWLNDNPGTEDHS